MFESKANASLVRLDLFAGISGAENRLDFPNTPCSYPNITHELAGRALRPIFFLPAMGCGK
ncbi:MAG: hypothetical protein D6722_02610 [Bacteroidetes bacterium]|nr:MAG: hypothetical protein D6722_02610 [Bacteroidota bacterium]